MDVEKLASKIVEKNKLIHASKEPRVAQLLVQLLEHKQGALGHGHARGPKAVERAGRNREFALAQIQVGRNAVLEGSSCSLRVLLHHRERLSSILRPFAGINLLIERSAPYAPAQAEAAEAARLEDLDTYVEDLYEDKLEHRVRASAMISHLFRAPENLPVLLEHPALIGALAR